MSDWHHNIAESIHKFYFSHTSKFRQTIIKKEVAISYIIYERKRPKKNVNVLGQVFRNKNISWR